MAGKPQIPWPSDESFLRQVWPAAKRSLHYAWKLWDPDRDGVPQVVDKCKDTPRGTPVEATGCTTPPTP